MRSKGKMKKVVKFLPLFILTISLLCVSQQTKETKLTKQEDIGIIETVVRPQKVLPGKDVYVNIILRNNAEGYTAENVTIVIHDVDPFKIVEYGNLVEDPYSFRSASNTFIYDLDPLLPYNSHGVRKMYPGEEIQFFWHFIAPSKEEIGDMYFEKEFFVTYQYLYKIGISHTIAARNYKEYIEKGTENIIYGSIQSSPGPLKFESLVDEPVLYYSDQDGSFAYLFNLRNDGDGYIIGNVTVIIEYLPAYVEPDLTNSKWKKLEENENKMNEVKELLFPGDETFDVRASRMIYIEVPSTQLVAEGLPLGLSFKIKPSEEPDRALPFYIYMYYTYLKESSFTIAVSPMKWVE